MSVRLVFADNLSWISGTEVGLQAMAEARQLSAVQLTALVERQGDRIEAVGFAVYQLGLCGTVRFVKNAGRYVESRDLVVLPRLTKNAGFQSKVSSFLCATVLTSEPGVSAKPSQIECFNRWDSRELAVKLLTFVNSVIDSGPN